jgi:hypothetical protein
MSNEHDAPLQRWKAQAAEFASRAEQGRAELRREEARILRQAHEAMASSAVFDDSRFVELLRRYLPQELLSTVTEIARGVSLAVDALNARAIEHDTEVNKLHREIADLRLELAQMRAGLAEAKLDRVLTTSSAAGLVN